MAEAEEADIARAVTAARQAFDEGPWPRMSHAQRAEYLRAIAARLRERSEDIGQVWPRESGVLHAIARRTGAGAARTFEFYAGLADTYPFVAPATPTVGEFGPGEGYLVAEIAEEVGLPPGVLNVVTADREASELLVRDPRVDKITFTGSTAAGHPLSG